MTHAESSVINRSTSWIVSLHEDRRNCCCPELGNELKDKTCLRMVNALGHGSPEVRGACEPLQNPIQGRNQVLELEVHPLDLDAGCRKDLTMTVHPATNIAQLLVPLLGPCSAFSHLGVTKQEKDGGQKATLSDSTALEPGCSRHK